MQSIRFSWRSLLWRKLLVVLVPGLLITTWLILTPPGLLGKADAVGYAVCHRIDARSFHLGSRTLPLCARCSGMYLGALLGLAYQLLWGRRGAMPNWKGFAIAGVLAAAFAVDGVNSYLHFFPRAPSLYEPHNWLRLVTGTGMGIAISLVLAPAFHQTLWREWVDQTAMQHWKQWVGLFFLAALLDLAVLGENVWVLYPLAVFSALGVLLLLTMVYTMVVLMIFRAENRYQRLQEAWLPLLAGFTVALLQVAVIDLGRYLLTGTWAGFAF